jgi:hypothetical protein
MFAAKPEGEIVNTLGIKPPKYIFEDQNINYNVLLQMAESGDLSAQYTLACDYLEEANSRIPDSLNEPENRYYKYSHAYSYFRNLEKYLERIKKANPSNSSDSYNLLSKTVRNGKWESAFCIVFFDIINCIMLVAFFSISKFMGSEQRALYNKKTKNEDNNQAWFFIYCLFQTVIVVAILSSIYYNNNGGFSAISSIFVCFWGNVWGACGTKIDSFNKSE